MATEQQAFSHRLCVEISQCAEHHLPVGWNFAILVFPAGAAGALDCVSNAQPTEVLRAMNRFTIAVSKITYEHEERDVRPE